jgi:hypothetical protein
MKRSKFAQFSLTLIAAILAVSCGGALDATIGGAVSGLSGGTSVGLLDNGGDALTVGANGNFTFATTVQAGNNYNVTISTQPVGETCTVQNGTGSVSQNHGDVTDVAVVCDATTTSTNYVFGSISGLASGATVTLLDNGTDSLAVTANGPFVFHTALAIGATYSVTVSTNPTNQTCTVASGTGVIPSSGTNATVTVTCQ